MAQNICKVKIIIAMIYYYFLKISEYQTNDDFTIQLYIGLMHPANQNNFVIDARKRFLGKADLLEVQFKGFQSKYPEMFESGRTSVKQKQSAQSSPHMCNPTVNSTTVTSMHFTFILGRTLFIFYHNNINTGTMLTLVLKANHNYRVCFPLNITNTCLIWSRVHIAAAVSRIVHLFLLRWFLGPVVVGVAPKAVFQSHSFILIRCSVTTLQGSPQQLLERFIIYASREMVSFLSEK